MPLPQVPLDDAAFDWRNKPINYGFSENYPIFWGPQQLTVYPDQYMNPIGWRDATIMQIPIVIRGFSGGNSTSPPPVVPPPPAGDQVCGAGKPRWHYLGTRRITTGQYISSKGATNTCTGGGINLGSYWYMHAMTFSNASFNFGSGSLTAQQVLQGNTGLFRFGVFTTTSGSFFSNNTVGKTGVTSTTLTCPAGSETITHDVWGVNAGTQLPYPTTGLPDVYPPGSGLGPNGTSLDGQLKPGQESYYRDASWKDLFVHYFFDCGGGPGYSGPVCIKVSYEAGVPESC